MQRLTACARAIRVTCAALIALVGTDSAAQGVPPTAGCRSAEAAQFDFWVGDWNVAWRNADGTRSSGRNRIARTLDGCAIVEQFDGRPGSPLQGTSVSVFDRASGVWRQTWVDNTGAWLVFEGGWASGAQSHDGRMQLIRRATVNGRAVMQRMVFHTIRPDALTWDWQRSDDDGVTWQTTWQLNYTRRPQ